MNGVMSNTSLAVGPENDKSLLCASDCKRGEAGIPGGVEWERH